MSGKVNKKVLLSAAVTAGILALMLIILGLIEMTVGAKSDRLGFLGAGERWSADGEKYAVICAYMEDEAGVSADQLSQWEYSMNVALTEAAVSSEGRGRPWTWTASFEDDLTASGAKGTVNALTTVCAGDFFVFHDMDFIYGSGFSTDGRNPMGVVLDENLAWKLFGATNIVGMTFNIHDEEYTVTGIVRPESDKGVYGYTYGTRARMYMSYAGYAKLSDGVFTTYEAALPNPVKSFGRNIFDNVVSLNEDKSDVIEVTDRFSLKNRFDNMKKLRYSWISVNRIEYPYWENEARVYDYRCAGTMICEIVLASIGGAALIASVVLVVVSGYSVIVSVKNIFRRCEKKNKKKKKHL